MSARADNRARMPLTAAWVDSMRKVFGDGVKVRYAKEGDVEVGTPDQDTTPHAYLRAIEEMRK